MTPSPRLPVRALAFAVVFPLAHACAAVAQPVLGPLSWQLQPFCNVVTLTLTSGPAGFALDGTDNLCGASNKASAVGVASPRTRAAAASAASQRSPNTCRRRTARTVSGRRAG